MTISKRDLEKRNRDKKSELAELEARCKDGSGTKDDYISLAKLRKKMR